MKKIDTETRAVLEDLLQILIPSGMSASEKKELAGKAGLNPNSLRVGIHRKSISADTLIRLMLARGIAAKSLKQLPQTELHKLSKGESDWLELGRQSSEDERVEFTGLIRFLKSRWKLR